MKNYINPEGLVQSNIYTQVIETQGGRTIYIAGQVAWDADGNVVADDFQGQTKKVFANLKTAVESAGGTMADLVKMTIYIVNYQEKHREIILTALNDYLDSEKRPTSTLVGVQSLARPDLLIEIDAIAVID